MEARDAAAYPTGKEYPMAKNQEALLSGGQRLRISGVGFQVRQTNCYVCLLLCFAYIYFF